jgi:hypothetical protein
MKVKSPGPVFFSQVRMGKNGKPFKIYKFRSMYMDAEERKKELMEIKLDPEVVDPDDIETLEDLIISAVNEAFRMQDEDYQENMNKISGGMGLGGLPF